MHSAHEEDYTMSTLSTLPARRLHMHIANASKRHSHAIDAAINNGMGEVRHSEMREFAAGSSLLARTRIARECIAAWEAYKAGLDELDARRAYHGGDRPIKRKESDQ